MLVRFDPFHSSFDRFFATRPSFAPALPMDVSRHEDRYVVRFDLPGIDPGSIDLTVDGQELTLVAERSLSIAEGEKVVTAERPRGRVSRRLRLGRDLDPARLAASYEHGVLTVEIPFAEGSGPRKVAIGHSNGTAGELSEASAA